MTDSTTWPPALPLVAILRGLQPERALEVARVLFDAGFRALEVPLNRPGAIAAIAAIVPQAPADACIGAGTVLDTAQVDTVGDTGATLIVSPHFDVAVVRRARERGMRTVPGVFTASEAFAAWRAGADALKIFPAEAMTHAALDAYTNGRLGEVIANHEADERVRRREIEDLRIRIAELRRRRALID